MAFSAWEYMQAARERSNEAHQCYERGLYVVAHYLAGLSVECLFRAYRVQKDQRFDARHDLHLLRKRSSFYEFIPIHRVVDVSTALHEVALRWSNDDRYRSKDALRRKLKNAKLDRGIRGDFLKENCGAIVQAALLLVSIGGHKWKS